MTRHNFTNVWCDFCGAPAMPNMSIHGDLIYRCTVCRKYVIPERKKIVTENMKFTDSREVWQLMKEHEGVAVILSDLPPVGLLSSRKAHFDLADLADYRYVFDIIVSKQLSGGERQFKLEFYKKFSDTTPTTVVIFGSEKTIECPQCNGKGEYADGDNDIEFCFPCDGTGRIPEEDKEKWIKEYETQVLTTEVYLEILKKKLYNLRHAEAR